MSSEDSRLRRRTLASLEGWEDAGWRRVDLEQLNPAWDSGEGRVWVVFCHWDKPYFIENQYELLGVFTSHVKAAECARQHEEYAASVREHSDLGCECVVFTPRLDTPYVAGYWEVEDGYDPDREGIEES